MKNNHGIISIFARHKVAANLLMSIMILSGIFALMRINVQFLPSFNIEIIKISVVWNGASAEDIENSIINPAERELRDLDNLKKMSSISRNSLAVINLEFEQGTNMSEALEQVRENVGQIRDFPDDAEPAIINRIEPYESVAKIVISGPDNLDELRPIAHRFERQLLDRGIAKVDVFGLPEQEIAIQVPIAKLVELRQSLPQLSQRIAQRSQDLPAGTIGKSQVGRQLRSVEQHRDIRGFEQMPILSDEKGQTIKLSDIATITQRPQDREVIASRNGKPAVELRLLRTEDSNAITSANILHQWLKEIKPTLGDSLQIKVYDENWLYIKERINLLIKNGLGGLILIILILFLMLNRHVALWVVVGIPTSFFAGMAALYLYGGSINMVSLFAFIMTLGIIVDDTIVVGEQALTNIHKEKYSLISAIENATYKMLAPIMSSSLTTVCAFFPLFFVGGIIGTIIFSIPLVVICVIFASVIECFLVLPGHLNHSFRREKQRKTIQKHPVREIINQRFENFKQNYFKRLVMFALDNRASTLSIALALFVISIGFILGDHINFTFFPTPEDRALRANVQFIAGTPPQEVKTFLEQLNKTLQETNSELSGKGPSIIQTAVTFENYGFIDNNRSNSGEQYASINIELSSPDTRDITNDQFITAWKKKINLPAGLENFSIISPRRGPPGEDIDIQLSGTSSKSLKAAALDIQNSLATTPGVSNLKDDLPFGQQQLVYKLNPTGKALGMTTESVGRQLRAAFNGQVAQIFFLPNEEIEVRVVLPDNERYSLATLENFPVITPANDFTPLGNVVELRYRSAPDIILHTDTKNTVNISAKVDSRVNNANKILSSLQKSIFPEIIKQYNLQITLRGKAEEQQETLTDMKYGLFLGLTLIYIILSWVFSSYGWPLVVMSVIPLGLTGAIIGHLVMGIDLTVLSLFGLFGLSGIVINDSIILLSEYKHLLNENYSSRDAIIEASCRRLRAVMLTSMTTIAGLVPLLFETSLQAQFLIPMATSICFGLAYATLLILVVVPVLLSIYEERHRILKPIKTGAQ